MSLKKQKEEKTTHIHNWKPSFKESEEVCSCGSVLISQEEGERRRKVWKDYFDSVRQTHPYERFLQQKIAFELNDMKFVKGCAQQAQRDMNDPEVIKNYLVKPSFPDPSTWNKYEYSEKNDTVEVTKDVFRKYL